LFGGTKVAPDLQRPSGHWLLRTALSGPKTNQRPERPRAPHIAASSSR
jgi:hypothetical protein